MKLFDLIENQEPQGHYNEKDDGSVAKISDRRRTTKLTLTKLNNLRMMHDASKLEHEKKLEQIQKQYTPPAEAGGGLGM
jgi:hypothetical protein